MKRGKEEEENFNIPMFPRLHVNDRDKGGPRAPPRNKMALYEQLSIPSQRFSSSNLNPRSIGPSSSQGNSHGKTIVSPCNASTSMLAYSAEKSNSRSFNGENMNSNKHVNFKPPNTSPSVAGCRPLHQPESSNAKSNCRKRVDDDDDFRVPTFDNSANALYLNKDTTCTEKKVIGSSSQKPLEQTNTSNMGSGRHERNLNNQKLNDLNDAVVTGVVYTEKSRSHLELSNTNISNRTCQESCEKDDLGRTECVEDMDDHQNDQNVDDALRNEKSQSKTSFSDELQNMADTCNRRRDASDKLMVEPILGIEISPDDVVGAIGPKQFWKARRAIVNQQRVFAIQVFELHRLIKVQKLLAASPHLLLDENPSVTPQKVPIKNLPIETYLRPQPENPNPKQQDDSQRSSEGPPPVHGGTYSGNPLRPPRENGTNPWCFPPPTQTWLVPVMSPSEGLIYKPYAGSWPPAGGFVGPVYGNYNSMSVQPQQQQQLQQKNFPSYFPNPYSLPTVMNSTVLNSAVEQVHPLADPMPNALTQQNSRSSCNMSFPRGDAITARPMKFQSSKESELQGSTASSPCEGRDMLPRFRTAMGGEGSARVSETLEKETSIRVIKVVPRNARSATESAVRIFKSLQEERQQYEQ